MTECLLLSPQGGGGIHVFFFWIGTVAERPQLTAGKKNMKIEKKIKNTTSSVWQHLLQILVTQPNTETLYNAYTIRVLK